MVPNPDPKQYWNNWENDVSLFSATNQERPYEELLHNYLELWWQLKKFWQVKKSFALEMSPCWQIFLQNKHNFG